jgi:hydroxyacylglutathione hydrolase
MNNILTFKNIENSNNYYLIEFEDSLVAVDPPRDAWRVIYYAESIGKNITHVLETHIHNDYLTGAFEIKERFQSTHVVPNEKVTFDHVVADESFTIESNQFKISAFHTPGHTYTHVSYKLFEHNTLVAVFSGGSVTSAGVGRTDLISEKDTPVLTKHQFESKNLFLTFDDNVHILPTHGQGSFCSVSSKPLPDYPTIESLKIDNTLLTVESMKEFERQLLDSLGAYPTYFGTTNAFNTGESRLIKDIKTPIVTTDLELLKDLTIIDTSIDKDFRVENSLKIPLSKTFSSYVGWVVSSETSMALVFEDSLFQQYNSENLTSIDNLELLEHDEISKALVALYRIGFEQIVYLVPLSQLKKTKVSTVTKDTYNNEEFYDIRELNEKSSSEEFTFDTLSRYYYQHKSLPNEFIKSNISNLSCGSGYRAGLISSILAPEIETKILKDTSIDFSKK